MSAVKDTLAGAANKLSIGQDKPAATNAVKVYVDETTGSDEGAEGTKASPFKTAATALAVKGQDVQPWIKKSTPLDDKEKPLADADGFIPLTASGLKKAKKLAEQQIKKLQKQAEAAQKAQAQAEEDSKKLEESKTITLEPDTKPARKIKINKTIAHRGERVKIFGWVHRLRSQKDLTFIVLRDGTGYLQCILQGKLAQMYDALTLTLESSVELRGTIKPLPEGKEAPGGHELIVDWWQVIGKAPGGDEAVTNLIAEDADPSILADRRHLVIRGQTASAVLKVRSGVLKAFRQTLEDLGLTEVTPPCMVQTSVEGGSTLFHFKYYDEDAYLTQSSQLYLETVLPSLGDCFCVQESFRAEKSHTRRHLSEYTHLEGELAFISFEDLLQHLEDTIAGTIERLLSDPEMKALIEQLNPGFQPPQRPYKRMDYKDAIAWLNEHGIKNEDGTDHKIGDDIAEAAERKMTDAINVPILLTGFPREIKSFYMQRIKGDERFTESVDLLMPGVGEIVGGSMRMDDPDELLAAYKSSGIPSEPYYWYTDQRKYGTCEHGGYGLGIERFLAWLTNRYTVRECSLYPRYTGRAKP